MPSFPISRATSPATDPALLIKRIGILVQTRVNGAYQRDASGPGRRNNESFTLEPIPIPSARRRVVATPPGAATFTPRGRLTHYRGKYVYATGRRVFATGRGGNAHRCGNAIVQEPNSRVVARIIRYFTVRSWIPADPRRLTGFTLRLRLIRSSFLSVRRWITAPRVSCIFMSWGRGKFAGRPRKLRDCWKNGEQRGEGVGERGNDGVFSYIMY